MLSIGTGDTTNSQSERAASRKAALLQCKLEHSGPSLCQLPRGPAHVGCDLLNHRHRTADLLRPFVLLEVKRPAPPPDTGTEGEDRVQGAVLSCPHHTPAVAGGRCGPFCVHPVFVTATRQARVCGVLGAEW